MRTKKRNSLAAPATIILATACIIGANAAAARVDDLTGQRDIYRSRAINWETEALEAEEQVQELKAQLAAAQQASAESAVRFRYAGEFSCTAYCSEKYEHICGTGDGITASGAPTIDPESLPPHWRKSAETPPTRKDADDFGRIVVWGSVVRHVDLTYWYNAVQYLEVIPFWMPCPKSPEKQDSEVCGNE